MEDVKRENKSLRELNRRLLADIDKLKQENQRQSEIIIRLLKHGKNST